MLILRPSNSGLKRLINIQKCRSSTKLDHCAFRAFRGPLFPKPVAGQVLFGHTVQHSGSIIATRYAKYSKGAQSLNA